MNQKELDKVLELHKKWLNNEEGVIQTNRGRNQKLKELEKG